MRFLLICNLVRKNFWTLSEPLASCAVATLQLSEMRQCVWHLSLRQCSPWGLYLKCMCPSNNLHIGFSPSFSFGLQGHGNVAASFKRKAHHKNKLIFLSAEHKILFFVLFYTSIIEWNKIKTGMQIHHENIIKTNYALYYKSSEVMPIIFVWEQSRIVKLFT